MILGWVSFRLSTAGDWQLVSVSLTHQANTIEKNWMRGRQTRGPKEVSQYWTHADPIINAGHPFPHTRKAY